MWPLLVTGALHGARVGRPLVPVPRSPQCHREPSASIPQSFLNPPPSPVLPLPSHQKKPREAGAKRSAKSAQALASTLVLHTLLAAHAMLCCFLSTHYTSTRICWIFWVVEMFREAEVPCPAPPEAEKREEALAFAEESPSKALPDLESLHSLASLDFPPPPPAPSQKSKQHRPCLSEKAQISLSLSLPCKALGLRLGQSEPLFWHLVVLRPLSSFSL